MLIDTSQLKQAIFALFICANWTPELILSIIQIRQHPKRQTRRYRKSHAIRLAMKNKSGIRQRNPPFIRESVGKEYMQMFRSDDVHQKLKLN